MAWTGADRNGSARNGRNGRLLWMIGDLWWSVSLVFSVWHSFELAYDSAGFGRGFWMDIE